MPAHSPLCHHATTRRPSLLRRCGLTFGAVMAALLGVAALGAAQQPTHVNTANWTLANNFTPEALRPILYTSAVAPHWIGKSDSLWYNWKDHTGSSFFLVVPALKVKRLLFDHTKLAAALTAASGHAYDSYNLPFTTLDISKDHKSFEFNADSSRWKWTLAAETLERVGKATRETEPSGGRGGGGGFGGRVATSATSRRTARTLCSPATTTCSSSTR